MNVQSDLKALALATMGSDGEYPCGPNSPKPVYRRGLNFVVDEAAYATVTETNGDNIVFGPTHF